jgi:AcrR family transcriptional regulator
MTQIAETERHLRADARRNRERILEASRAAFAESGAEAQMDDVARRAGVGVGTVYRHFPTKEALMAELVRQKFASFCDNARAALDAPGDPFEVLADLLRHNAELMAADAGARYAVLTADERVWESSRPEKEELMALTEELIERAHQAGSLRRDFTAEDVPMMMCGVSAIMGLDIGATAWRRHLDLILDGVRA